MSGDYEVGWGRPPKHSQFPPNVSGNPKGRPKGTRKELPYAKVLDQLVTVHQNGEARLLPADQAFVLATTEMGMNNPTIANITLAAMRANGRRKQCVAPLGMFIFRCYTHKGDPQDALQYLGMARKQDAYRPTARLMLEPWVVEEQLALLGDRHLTENEQAVILASTRLPHKVKWPEWWSK